LRLHIEGGEDRIENGELRIRDGILGGGIKGVFGFWVLVLSCGGVEGGV
jgi:hypothetical protein